MHHAHFDLAGCGRAVVVDQRQQRQRLVAAVADRQHRVVGVVRKIQGGADRHRAAAGGQHFDAIAASRAEGQILGELPEDHILQRHLAIDANRHGSALQGGRERREMSYGDAGVGKGTFADYRQRERGGDPDTA